MHPFGSSLVLLQRPGQYIGNEPNAVYKATGPETLRIALVYPETYEIGMSNLGLKIIYHILNAQKDVYAERAFLPEHDALLFMQKNKIPLFTLEQYTPLNKMDVIGFSVHTELNYTNILLSLELADIPLLRDDRDERHPIVVVGGPASFNPLPLAKFIDAFFVGDGEGSIKQAVHVLKHCKQCKKYDKLKELAKIDSIYVPGISKGARKATTSLNFSDFPIRQIVPNMDIIHNRYVVEIMRGCTRGCRFCQGGFTYRPARWRSPEDILKILRQGIAATGFENVSLLAFTTTDYPYLRRLLFDIRKSMPDISVSLPSLPVDAFDDELFGLLNSMKKFNITIAPETVSERLRRVINKNVTLSDIERTINLADKYNYNRIKLYFIIGLPTETEQDVLEIPRFAREIAKMSGRISFHIKLSPFVPRPHTPFELEKQEEPELILEKIHLIKGKLGYNRRIRVSYHDPYKSYIEGILGRGNEKSADIVLQAYKMGAKFDERKEFFDFSIYRTAFEKLGINPAQFTKPIDAPWHIIDTGVYKKYLDKQREAAYKGLYEKNCEYEGCRGCGIWIRKTDFCNVLPVKNTAHEKQHFPKFSENGTICTGQYLLQYSKESTFIYIGQNETIQALLRGLNRAGISVCKRKGFKKRPDISAQNATPLGIESKAEFIFFRTNTNLENTEHMVALLNSAMPQGLRVVSLNRAKSKHDAQNIKIIYRVKLQKDAKIAIKNESTCELSKEGEWLFIKPDKDNFSILSFLSSLLNISRAQARQLKIIKDLGK